MQISIKTILSEKHHMKLTHRQHSCLQYHLCDLRLISSLHDNTNIVVSRTQHRHIKRGLATVRMGTNYNRCIHGNSMNIKG